MVKTIFHWKVIYRYLIYAFLVVISWGIVSYIIAHFFNPPFKISLLVCIIGGVLVGGGFSCVFSKKYSLYHFEERKCENG